MYFFVPYQLIGIQKGIQCGHAVEQYAHNNCTDPEYLDYIKNWRTWIVLDGGTTNSNPKEFGTLNLILIALREAKIKYGYFHEPDLNSALTAVCFLADERVFNKELYPDYIDSKFYDYGDTDGWEQTIGNAENIFLRELIRGKRKANG